MSKQLFVNLPVKDLDTSKEFFTALGFSINPQFSDENAACVVISDAACVMLLVEPFFKSFTSKDVADASKSTEAILALSAESRQEVDDLVSKALAAGGKAANPFQDEGPMYGGSFQDPDGHLWEVMYMDMSAFEEPGQS